MQSALVNSSRVALEWLEIPAHPVTECHPDACEDTCVLIHVSQDYPVLKIPYQPEMPAEVDLPVAEQSQRPSCERREPACLRVCVRTVVCKTV